MHPLAADDHDQLGLVVHLGSVLATGRQRDRIAGIEQRRGRLHEDDRMLRDRCTCLPRMLPVVESDAENIERNSPGPANHHLTATSSMRDL